MTDSEVNLLTEIHFKSLCHENVQLKERIRTLEAEKKKLREALQIISSMTDLTFAECSDAEKIICTGKKALEEVPE